MNQDWNDPEIAAKRAKLKERSRKCAMDLLELMPIDPTPSIHSSETNLLSDLVEELTRYADAGQIRLMSALRIMELCFDLQDDCTAERKRQIERHTRQ